jgi:hypothetical protein
MLSSVLNSDRAGQVNIEIMRAFVRLRESTRRHCPSASQHHVTETAVRPPEIEQLPKHPATWCQLRTVP